ncbi:MAG TPA: hydrogenase maturation protease [Polyangiaceae bacterium LLY-WYZ-14_1]|nr:hydrogenase maturation protease [Polyangiaceae bacterium LLY-WYZ-14_1]
MLTIVGCGNPNRSDDGVGVVVARRLQEWLADHPVPGVQVFDCGTAGMEVMFGARGSQHLIILDACTSGSEPGAVFCVPGEELEAEHEPVFSLHDFRWDHALAAGRRIFRGDFPDQVEVFLVEAASLEFGIGLSSPVARAADAVTEDVLLRIRSWSAMGELVRNERMAFAEAVSR